MEQESPSITALVTARMRYLHSASDPKPLLQDAWGGRFSPAAQLVSMGYLDAVDGATDAASEEAIDQVLRASPAYANVIVRSWYTETALASAIAGGVGQYVLIGAGFDSYACRRPEAARDLQVIEIDHPATQRLKRARLEECGAPVDDKLHFISADLGLETLESALARSSFDAGAPAFLSWLGVTMYLSRQANMATLESVARFCAPGSQLVFSYIDQALFEAMSAVSTEDFDELKQSVKSVGEPFVSGFHPHSLAGELSEIGLELEEDIDDLQIIERCDPEALNRFSSTESSRLARVRVR
jgi:methyltransferase (TIGR00027 family)